MWRSNSRVVIRNMVNVLAKSRETSGRQSHNSHNQPHETLLEDKVLVITHKSSKRRESGLLDDQREEALHEFPSRCLWSLFLSFARTELLHRAELIGEEPFLHNLAIAQAKDRDSCDRHLLACGSQAREGSLVGATLRHPDHHLVSFGNQILNRRLPIREGSKQDQHPLLIALAPRRGSRKGIMMESIGGKDLEHCHIPGIYAFEEMADHVFVLF